MRFLLLVSMPFRASRVPPFGFGKAVEFCVGAGYGNLLRLLSHRRAPRARHRLAWFATAHHKLRRSILDVSQAVGSLIPQT